MTDAPATAVRLHAARLDRGGRTILSGLDLVGPTSSITAVLGPSGSGKSTLLALLLRLRDSQAGGICWEGVDLREASLPELHRRVALLPQDAPVFLGTVRDNLRIGDPDADDAGLWEALRQAGLDEEIRALPGGIDQWLGEGGRTLSAGQARRLCLARVLLSDATVLVLDEPTEGLAPVIVDQLADIFNLVAGQGTALLLIEQNLSLVARVAHRYLAMAKGAVVAEGSVENTRDCLKDIEKHVMV